MIGVAPDALVKEGEQINVFPGLKAEDFHYWRLTFQPDTENVLSRVHVPIMVRSAVAAHPASYSKRAHTFRTTDGNTPAARARLGSPSFVSFDVASVVPSGLIRKLATECRPSRVEHGFCHPCLSELCRIHIADDDQFVFTNKPRGLFVKVMATRVGDLGMDRVDAPLVMGALRHGELRLVSPIVLQGGNGVAVAARRERLKPKINSDLTITSRKIVIDLALESDIPAPPSVLREAAALDGTADVARAPEVEGALHIGDASAVDLHGAIDKRNPAESTLRAAAGAKTRTMLVLVARNHELAADGLHGVGMQSKLATGPGAEFDKIECARPARLSASLPTGLRLALDLAAIVPNLITSPRMAVQVLPDRGVLYAIFEREHHAPYILVCVEAFKWTSQNIVGAAIRSRNWSATLFLSPNTGARFLTTRRSIGSRRTSPRSARRWIASL